MNVLVAFGSESGGTAGIAARIGEALREAGLGAQVLPAREVRDLGGYDAVLIGGALLFRPPKILPGFLALLRSALRAGEPSFVSMGLRPIPTVAPRPFLVLPDDRYS